MYLCLFPTWYRCLGGGGLTLCLAPGPGLTIEGHSGETSVMPSFLEDQNMSLHVKFEDIQCLSKFWEKNPHRYFPIWSFCPCPSGIPCWRVETRLTSFVIYRVTLEISGSQGVLVKFFQLVNCLCDDLTWGFLKTTA